MEDGARPRPRRSAGCAGVLTMHLPLMLDLLLKQKGAVFVFHLVLVTSALLYCAESDFASDYFGSSLSKLTLVGFRAFRRSSKLRSSAMTRGSQGALSGRFLESVYAIRLSHNALYGGIGQRLNLCAD